MSRAPVNAFDVEFVDAWYTVLDEVAGSGCAILHVRSSEKVFSAGADLKMMRAFFAGVGAGEKLVAHVKRMQDIFNRIEALPIVLAEISGSALGGGFELVLACDLRVAGYGALFGLPESRIGLIPGAGGTQRLTKLSGMATAKRIILGCDMVDGKTAEEIGLVQWSVPDHELSFFCNSLAARISQSSTAALAASKRCLVKTESSIDSGLEAGRHETLCLLETADTQSRVRAFLDGRSAR
jgi:enoyl-CoA hydratase/carnithine racemase